MQCILKLKHDTSKLISYLELAAVSQAKCWWILDILVGDCLLEAQSASVLFAQGIVWTSMKISLGHMQINRVVINWLALGLVSNDFCNLDTIPQSQHSRSNGEIDCTGRRLPISFPTTPDRGAQNNSMLETTCQHPWGTQGPQLWCWPPLLGLVTPFLPTTPDPGWR